MKHLFLLLFACTPLAAQAPALNLDIFGDWRVKRSDNPAFAKPDYDGSAWADTSQLALSVRPVQEILYIAKA